MRANLIDFIQSKKKSIFWAIALLVIASPILLVYLTISNSTDCSQLVIDGYEIHSGINIPEVDFVNCYFDKQSNTRVSVYDLNAYIDLSKFKPLENKIQSSILHSIHLLDETERPNQHQLYLASGEKWGTKWTYLVDNDSKRLWAELQYHN